MHSAVSLLFTVKLLELSVALAPSSSPGAQSFTFWILVQKSQSKPSPFQWEYFLEQGLVIDRLKWHFSEASVLDVRQRPQLFPPLGVWDLSRCNLIFVFWTILSLLWLFSLLLPSNLDRSGFYWKKERVRTRHRFWISSEYAQRF